MTAKYKRLPPPDERGNYWLGEHSAKAGSADPAIFRSKRLEGKSGEAVVVDNGSFFVFLGSERGFLFDGVALRRFKSAVHALDAINEEVGE